jgi:hypothetical protein
MFSAITMNHLRAKKAWADAHKGQTSLDLSSFELEIKARNRYYRLYPQFLMEVNGRMSHVETLAPQATSFLGWRPYRPLSCNLALDKLGFKTALLQAGLPTPAHWNSAEHATADFILKRSIGSFGYQLAGPFHRGQVPEVPPALSGPQARGQLYAEAFVTGQNIKVWYWGSHPVHVQCQPYPFIEGDGQQAVEVLAARRLGAIGEELGQYKEFETVLSCLAYQHLDLETILPKGQKVWLDYRYGRRFSNSATTESEDNALPRLPEALRAQVVQAGHWLAHELKHEMATPILCTMDAVLDDHGKFWWLEVNSNPVCPPTAYFAMLASLFGTSPETPANAFAERVRVARASAGHELDTKHEQAAKPAAFESP